jgi:hypothetical protein
MKKLFLLLTVLAFVPFLMGHSGHHRHHDPHSGRHYRHHRPPINLHFEYDPHIHHRPAPEIYIYHGNNPALDCVGPIHQPHYWHTHGRCGHSHIFNHNHKHDSYHYLEPQQ